MKFEKPIFFFTRIAVLYRGPVLTELNKRLNGRLIVCYGQAPRESSLMNLQAAPEQVRVLALRNYWLAGERIHVQPFRKPFREFGDPAVILAEASPRSLSLPAMIWYSRFRHIPTVLWGHFSSNERAFSPANWSDRYYLYLARKASACVCYTEEIASLLRPHVPDEELFVATNTLDMAELFRLRAVLGERGKEVVRRELGLRPDLPTFIFMGRLIASKGTDMLLQLMRDMPDVQWIVVGDGPERSSLETACRNESLRNVHIVGARIAFDDSAPYLYASDVMLIPGPVGLVVNQAFAFGLPVVTQASPGPMRFHGPEVAYIRHDVNGMFARFGNLEDMISVINHVLTNLDRFSRAAIEYAESNLTLDRMVDGLEAAIRYAEQRTP